MSRSSAWRCSAVRSTICPDEPVVQSCPTSGSRIDLTGPRSGSHPSAPAVAAYRPVTPCSASAAVVRPSGAAARSAQRFSLTPAQASRVGVLSQLAASVREASRPRRLEAGGLPSLRVARPGEGRHRRPNRIPPVRRRSSPTPRAPDRAPLAGFSGSGSSASSRVFRGVGLGVGVGAVEVPRDAPGHDTCAQRNLDAHARRRSVHCIGHPVGERG